MTDLNCNRNDVDNRSPLTAHVAMRGTSSHTVGKIAFTSTVTMGDINSDVIVFSNSTNLGPPAGGAIEVQGSSTATVWGYVYAPRGRILVDGSNNLTVKGKTIGEAITLNGTGRQASDGAYFSGTPTVQVD